MKTWEAAPLLGINGVLFGMTREEVRRVLGPSFVEFKKNKFSHNTADDYGVAHIYYDAENKCDAVEVFADVAVSIAGKQVFPTTIKDAKAIIPDLEYDGYGYISAKKAVGISVSEGKMESILFGIEGYYG